MDPKTMSLREQEHLYWSKQGTTTEMYKSMIDHMLGISDEQIQHCFREYGKYCLRGGTLNDCSEERRVRAMLLSVNNLLNPKYNTRSTAIRRLGDILWEVSLDVIEYVYATQLSVYL